MALCTVEGISLTKNGSPIGVGDTVNVGDTVGVSVSTDPGGGSVVVAVGQNPKPGCIQCGLTCDPPSNHFTNKSGTGGSTVTFDVTQQWLDEAKAKSSTDPAVLIGASCIGTFNSSEFCNEDSVRIRVRQQTGDGGGDEEEEEEDGGDEVAPAPEGCTVNSFLQSQGLPTAPNSVGPLPVGDAPCIEAGIVAALGLGLVLTEDAGPGPRRRVPRSQFQEREEGRGQ